jgi:hypothetical protein
MEDKVWDAGGNEPATWEANNSSGDKSWGIKADTQRMSVQFLKFSSNFCA